MAAALPSRPLFGPAHMPRKTCTTASSFSKSDLVMGSTASSGRAQTVERSVLVRTLVSVRKVIESYESDVIQGWPWQIEDPMWTVENRGSYDRGGLRYPSDVTDDEWAHIAPLIPPAKRGGRKRNVDVRDVVNGLMYILSTGCQWRAIPKDLPPRSTLFGYFELWDYDGTLDRIHHSLYVKCRETIGREASPTACVIDSQSA